MKKTLSHKKKMQRGFTLLELLISVVILSILMVATAEIFSRSSLSYRTTRQFENSISDSQFLMNLIAKELRTSTVVSPTTDSMSQSVKFFEYSKSECVQYRFNATTLKIEVARTASGTAFSSCNNTTDLTGFVPIGTGQVTGYFNILPSRPASPGPQRIGRVTMYLNVQSNGAPVVLQTTTSLRDYGYVGLQ